MNEIAKNFSELFAKLEDLPTLPRIAQELSQAIANPMATTVQIEKLIGRDVSMTVKVLRLVNSAYYAIPGGVTNLGRAVGFLGFDTVHQLVLSASIFSAMEHVHCEDFNITDFWKHSVGTGMAAETLARMVKHKSPADLFTAGLIHDIGKVAYIAVAPKTFSQIVQECSGRRISFTEAETLLQVPSHVEVGLALAQRWKLPENLQSTILYHHQKDPALRPHLKPQTQKEVDIVMLANLFIHGLNFGNSGHSQISSAPKNAFDRLGLNTKSLPQISKEISKSLQSCDTFLKVLSSGQLKKTSAA